MKKIFTVQILGILISIILMFVLTGILFWLHLISFLIFHLLGGLQFVLDSPNNEESFDEEWSMNNDLERLSFHSISILAVAKKLWISFILSGNISNVNVHYILLPLIVILSIFQYKVNSFPFWYSIVMYSSVYIIFYFVKYLLKLKKEEKGFLKLLWDFLS